MRMSWIFPIITTASMLTNAQSTEAMKIDTTEVFAGNTLEITNKYGTTPIYFAPDGQFQQRGGEGKTVSGIWRVEENQLCVAMRIEPDGRLANEFCMNVANKRLGDYWTSEDPRNGTIRYRLVKGRTF